MYIKYQKVIFFILGALICYLINIHDVSFGYQLSVIDSRKQVLDELADVPTKSYQNTLQFIDAGHYESAKYFHQMWIAIYEHDEKDVSKYMNMIESELNNKE